MFYTTSMQTDGNTLTREQVDQMKGPVILEFGAQWCPHCQALEPQLAELLKKFPGVTHLKVEDGRGKTLGRSFKVKLWPNLVFLKDGKVFDQLARPTINDVEKRVVGIVSK